MVSGKVSIDLATDLPIAAIVPEVLAHAREGENLVILAEPGAGKTTWLPRVLLAAGWGDAGEIWVSQPRRIAARMAATRVAAGFGEEVGARVGYSVRFESAASKATRIRFVTEGILARRLVEDPRLGGIAAVVFDEFHERHIDSDLALALTRAAQRTRPDLHVAVMSATLEPTRVAAWLGVDPLYCPGRVHSVDVTHAESLSDRPLGQQVAAAFRELVELERGSVLAFLPGAREIREAEEACATIAERHDFEIALLHGELPGDEQDRAVRAGRRPKLILSTNVAETSITVDGVVAVIDTGLARQTTWDPWTGMPGLVLAKISRASATQRAGRAGRTRPGRCVRLYPRHDFERRAEHDTPELLRSDLSGPALTIRGAGFRHLSHLPWFEAPPRAAVDAAEALLGRIGAIDASGSLTAIGQAMLRHPVHPRLARVLEAASAAGIGDTAALAVALLSERPIRRKVFGTRTTTRVTAASDVVVDVDDLRAFARDPARARVLGLDPQACRTVLQAARALGARRRERDAHDDDDDDDDDDELSRALLAGFPDRVASVRGSGSERRKLAFAGGGRAELDEGSAVADADLVVALAAEQRREGGGAARVVVRSAARIDPLWLLELDPDRLEERQVAGFDPNRERVDVATETRWDGLLLESRAEPVPGPEAALALFEAARTRGPSAWVDDPAELDDLLARIGFAHGHDPEIARLDASDVEDVLREACNGCRSFAELRKADMLDRLLARLGAARARLERVAPSHVQLPGGRRLRVHYAHDRGPWAESRLQDFFGSVRGPTVAEGRVALALHLLAPNQRAVQITTDLSGFWDRHYSDIRKMLMRRYPKHAWPEDPRTAASAKPRRQ